MRAVVMRGAGGPEVLSVDEIAVPEFGADEVLVAVRAAGLNRADLAQRMGRYPAPAGVRPDVLGLEFAGVVAAVGAEVRRWQVGDRVFGIVAGAAQAEFVATAADLLAPIPAPLDDLTAAAVPEVFMTALDALAQGGLAAGQRVLVHAAGSGVGTAAVQLAKAAGATVYGTARTAAKLDQARALGLDAGFSGPQWAAELRTATGGAGVDLILDFVGASYLADNLASLAPRGRIVVIGTLGGAQAEINLGLLMSKRAQIIGTVLRSRPRAEKAALTAAFTTTVLPLLASGALRPVIDRVFALDEIAAAHGFLESNASFGKVVLNLAAPQL